MNVVRFVIARSQGGKLVDIFVVDVSVNAAVANALYPLVSNGVAVALANSKFGAFVGVSSDRCAAVVEAILLR